jgi:proteasome lid subunit RPN8/RPN11
MPVRGVEERGPARHGWRHLARQLWGALYHSLLGSRPAEAGSVPPLPAPAGYEPLRRLLLTDGVGRTLFEEYAAHRAEERGREETGWVLLGLRQRDQAVALATLPAGTLRDAGVAHVRFNSTAQEVGSRIVRQGDRRLTILGVVHTHPGSLRHPSDGDYEGDIEWVGHCRGREGVFGIGTADGPADARPALVSTQPRPNAQCLGELCFSWYSLREGQRQYRKLPVELTIGPDLARPLHDVWPTLEEHAERLERLFRQQARLSCRVADSPAGPALAVSVPLAEPGDEVRVLLMPKEARYYVHRGGEVYAVDCPADVIDQGVYLLLAELAAQAG